MSETELNKSSIQSFLVSSWVSEGESAYCVRYLERRNPIECPRRASNVDDKTMIWYSHWDTSGQLQSMNIGIETDPGERPYDRYPFIYGKIPDNAAAVIDDPADRPLIENPWIQHGYKDPTLTLTHGDQHVVYGFSNWTITTTKRSDIAEEILRLSETSSPESAFRFFRKSSVRSMLTSEESDHVRSKGARFNHLVRSNRLRSPHK